MTGAETRSKATDESVKKLEAQFQQYMTTNDERLDNLGKKLELLVEKLLPPRDGLLGSAPMEDLSNSGPIAKPWVGENKDHTGGRFHGHSSQSRVEIPYFDGIDPCAWLRKCERFFQHNHITDPQQKLEEAVLHLNGKAESWFFSCSY